MTDAQIDKITTVVKYFYLTIISFGVIVLIKNVLELGNLLN